MNAIFSYIEWRDTLKSRSMLSTDYQTRREYRAVVVASPHDATELVTPWRWSEALADLEGQELADRMNGKAA